MGSSDSDADRVLNLMHSREGCTLHMFQAVFPCSCLREPFGLKSSGWPPVLTLTSRQFVQDILMTPLVGFVGTFLGTDGAVVLPKASPGLPRPLILSPSPRTCNSKHQSPDPTYLTLAPMCYALSPKLFYAWADKSQTLKLGHSHISFSIPIPPQLCKEAP